MCMVPQTAAPVDLSKYIEVRLFGDRPHLHGRRIPVATLVHQQRLNNWDTTETAHNFAVSQAEMFAALLYYEEHRAEIDAQELREAQLFQEMKHTEQTFRL